MSANNSKQTGHAKDEERISSAARKQWHSPELRELGNLKTFVAVGGGGKSGSLPDGRSGETMD